MTLRHWDVFPPQQKTDTFEFSHFHFEYEKETSFLFSAPLTVHFSKTHNEQSFSELRHLLSLIKSQQVQFQVVSPSNLIPETWDRYNVFCLKTTYFRPTNHVSAILLFGFFVNWRNVGSILLHDDVMLIIFDNLETSSIL